MNDALYYNGSGHPSFELNAEQLCIPVEFTERGRQFRVYVRVRPLDYAANKKLLNNVTISESREPGASVAVKITSGDEVARELAEAHFIDLKGVKIVGAGGQAIDSQAARRAWLDRRPSIKESVGLRAGMYATKAALEEESPDFFFEDEGDIQEILTELPLADYEKGTDVLIPVKHILRVGSEEDRITYRKTVKTKTKSENRLETSWVTRNFDNVAKLYDRMAVSLIGAVIDEKPCTEENKGAWLPKVPLWWKALVMTEAFDRVESKNA